MALAVNVIDKRGRSNENAVLYTIYGYTAKEDQGMAVLSFYIAAKDVLAALHY